MSTRSAHRMRRGRRERSLRGASIGFRSYSESLLERSLLHLETVGARRGLEGTSWWAWLLTGGPMRLTFDELRLEAVSKHECGGRYCDFACISQLLVWLETR